MTPEQIFGIIFASLFVFVLIREVICWYFKINERVNQNKEIIKQLKISNERQLAGDSEND